MMTRDITEDLRDAFNSALPDIRRSLDWVELSVPGTDEEFVAILVDAVDGFADRKHREPEPLPRHERCDDCDAMILVHREGHDHCTVCDEDWPCPDAGRVDEERLAELREEWASLRSKPSRKRSETRRMESIGRRLEAEGLSPSPEVPSA